MEIPFLEKPVKKFRARSAPGGKKEDEGLFFEILLEQLDRHQKQVVRQFRKRFKNLVVWMDEQGYSLENLRVKAVRATATTAVTASLLLATLSPTAGGLPEIPQARQVLVLSKEEILKKTQNVLAAFKESKMEQTGQDLASLISQTTGLPATISLDGHKLERNVGLIGAEQHLYRYPGDNLADQLTKEDEKKMYWESGIAPGLGAWGHFASSKEAMTEDLVQKEKYYLAIQTFLVENWSKDWAYLKDWYKYRKMLVYNPKNGQAVVAVIADAGPATWTGKHLGGSPEVMHYLGLGTGPRKGEVVLLFLDDPNDKIPLGQVDTGTLDLALQREQK